MKIQFAYIIGTFLLITIHGISALSDKEIDELYQRWQTENQSCKQSEEQQIYRRQVFIENYRIIVSHNSNRENTYTLGLNQFADQTADEFAGRMLTQKEFSVESHDEDESSDKNEQFREELNAEIDSECGGSTIKGRLLSSPPSSIDWRVKGAVTPVKNQGSCGSCWAFSTTGMLEGVNFLRGGSLVQFSEQQLVDCCGVKGYQCHGCNGAWPARAIFYVMKYGILKSSSYPYIGFQSACKVQSPTTGFYVNQVSYLPPTTTALKIGIAKQPVSVVVDASNWYLYAGGVFGNCSSKKSKANHAVTAVGYTSSGIWIVKNSWGTGWGQQGYIYLAKGNTCGIKNYALVAKV